MTMQKKATELFKRKRPQGFPQGVVDGKRPGLAGPAAHSVEWNSPGDVGVGCSGRVLSCLRGHLLSLHANLASICSARWWTVGDTRHAIDC